MTFGPGAYTHILNAILLIGVALLTFGTIGLLTVRISNPRLRGLGWLGGALASGGTGALLLLLAGRVPSFLAGPCSEMGILLAFVLLQSAVLELMRERSRTPWLGLGLLGVEAVTQVCLVWVHDSLRIRIVALSLLVSVQVFETSVLLGRRAKVGMRASVWFSAGILACFGVVNGFRGAVYGLGLETYARLRWLEMVVFVGYLTAALGIAFGFFWMTTAQLSAELEHMASTDPLTRVYNRRVFRDWCEKELARSRRQGSIFSLLVMDVDHFKRVNDRFGHSVGDLVLCEVVEQLQDSVRGIDVLGRWGGEEFMALLPGASAEAALLVAERVRSNVERLRLPEVLPEMAFEGLGLLLTVSLGVASWRGGEDGVEAMLERADRALYRAKTEGRNRVLVAQSGLREVYSAR